MHRLRDRAAARLALEPRDDGAVLAVLGLRSRVAIERSRERRPETDEMAAALDGVDVVREGVDGFVVRVVVLERDLDIDGDVAVLAGKLTLAGDVDRRAVER